MRILSKIRNVSLILAFSTLAFFSPSQASAQGGCITEFNHEIHEWCTLCGYGGCFELICETFITIVCPE